MSRQYFVRLEMQMEGPDDLYEAHDHFQRLINESIMPLTLVDVQQMPREDQTQDRPKPEEQVVADIRSVDLIGVVVDVVDGVVYVDGKAAGHYSDLSELDKNKIDEALGEQRQLGAGE